MSFGSFLGGFAKGVGKAALGVVGNEVGLSNASTMFDSHKQAAPSLASQTRGVASVGSISGMDTQNTAGGSLLGAATDALSGIGNLFNGRTAIRTNSTVGVGALPSAGGTSSLLPIIAIGGLLLVMLMGNNKR